jgi:2-keto-3-deoxy-L-rhamnonate aldolase RhmA
MLTSDMSEFEFALWTVDPILTRVARDAGVQWIGPDLERIGKHERQAGTSSLISDHGTESLPMVREIVGPQRLFARCNGPGPHLAQEIEALIDAGVQCLMVPMIRRLDEARAVVEQVHGRARLVIMIEHKDILDQVDAVAQLPDLHTIYVGTNDLAISMGYATRFGPVADGWVERIARVAQARDVGFSFLGFAKLSLSTALAVPPDLVLAEYARLGVNWALFARSFAAVPDSFAHELALVKERLRWWFQQTPAALNEAHERFLDACARANKNGLHQAPRT